MILTAAMGTSLVVSWASTWMLEVDSILWWLCLCLLFLGFITVVSIVVVLWLAVQLSDPNVPVFYTNRSLCHLKLKQWQLALQDCRQALEVDSSLVKAHFFAGQALLELKMYDEAIMSLMQGNFSCILIFWCRINFFVLFCSILYTPRAKLHFVYLNVSPQHR